MTVRETDQASVFLPRNYPLGLDKIQIRRSQGLIAAILILLAAFTITNFLSASRFGYSDLVYMSTGGATLALAAMGAAIVVISGGFDLSVGATISLVNVVLATCMRDSVASQIAVTVAGLAVGAAVGSANGFLVAYARMQPIVATLATMFIVQGITLLIQDTPGGQLPASFCAFLTGDAIPKYLPAAVVVIALALLAWRLLKNSRLGTAVFAIGSDEHAALAAGIDVRRTKFLVYLIAGAVYGAAGIMASAQTGFGDPLIGNPLLLSVFAAVVIGGTALGGGRGGCAGPAVGGYILMLIINLLLVLNVSAYYSTVVTAVLLILAALGGGLNRNAALRRWRQWRPKFSEKRGVKRRLERIGRFSSRQGIPVAAPWTTRHRDLMRYAGPSYICFLGVVIATVILIGRFDLNYVNSILVLGTFLAVLALGQGAVVLTGGLDLSIPWTITLCGIIFTSLANGSDTSALWAIPVVLTLGGLIGLCNGASVVVLGLPAIVVTLAMNGILQGLALLYSNGAAAVGSAPPGLRWLLTGKVFGVTPSVFLTVLFVFLATALLSSTGFGRQVYAVGSSQRVARLSGVRVGRTLTLVYVLSGMCSALVGILYCGFSGQASLDMGQEYLLTSVAVVVVGGTLITGGRGHYLGMVGGVLLLTALQTLLAGTTLPIAMREIIFGFVVLVAVTTLRDRSRTA
jgi:ribose transport system permease protein